MATLVFWRKWHRWIGFPAALFLLFAATTGIVVACTEFFGEAERLREATRDLVSPVTITTPDSAWREPVARAFASAAAVAGDAPVDKIEVQFKGEQPTVTLFTGKPTGGEDRRLVFDARTGALLKNEGYADKPLINRIHSGEAFGDGGLVVAMFWGLSLIVLTVTGLIIYWRLRRPGRTGVERFFW
ncbi:MAG TPA: PepSY-associated TM helix domain-containing protein [Gemmatimonadaceae bacterium]|nr:PepSY-associated TM helix domain-containing protein [Gemmatimonadaceae bacterium]